METGFVLPFTDSRYTFFPLCYEKALELTDVQSKFRKTYPKLISFKTKNNRDVLPVIVIIMIVSISLLLSFLRTY